MYGIYGSCVQSVSYPRLDHHTAGCIYASREVNEARRPHTCSRPCAFEEKKRKKTRNLASSETHHEIHSSPATAIISRLRATKHVPRFSPYSPASIDPGFVEISLVQLSQSEKNDECCTYPHRHTDRLNNGTLYAPRYEEAKYGLISSR